MKAQKKIGFPINDSVVRRSFVATGGTVLASKLALDSHFLVILLAEATMLLLIMVQDTAFLMIQLLPQTI